MADKIIPFPEKKEPHYTWFIYECRNVVFKLEVDEFFLRSDGMIICPKCGEEIGTYHLHGHDNPKEPF